MEKKHIVIAGSGFAGLETAFVLRYLLKDQVKMTIVSDEENFLFRPNTIYIPFGLAPEKLQIPLKEVLPKFGIDFFTEPVEGIDPKESKLLTKNQKISFDYAVIATGSSMKPEEIPGLKEHANSIWTPKEMLELRSTIQKVIDDARNGNTSHILFLVPPNNKCSGPLYEVVMMVDTYLRRQGVRDKVEITWTTYESGYIQSFGPRLDETVSKEFQQRNIKGFKNYVVKQVTENKVLYQNGEEIPYDYLIAFPPYIASVTYEGLPSDDRGFLHTRFEDRSVQGFANIFAPGDAGDFPVKQAFLAFLQADTVAYKIHSDIIQQEFTKPFIPVSMCIMEQFDKATFAQVPLRMTGNPQNPVEVNPDNYHDYKVGVTPLWRLGKKLLGMYLPFRFRRANPFHAGAMWQAMEVGVKIMASLLAK